MAAYSASKAAVIALTKTAAKDLAHHSIRVNSVSPAFIGPGVMWDRQVELQAATPSQYFSDQPDEVAAQMINSVPLRRYGSLDEVAAAVLFLCPTRRRTSPPSTSKCRAERSEHRLRDRLVPGSSISDRRVTNMRRLVDDLAGTGQLRDDLSHDEAADIIWATNSTEF